MKSVYLDVSSHLFVFLCVPRVMASELMSGVQTVLTKGPDSGGFVASIACSHRMFLVVQSQVSGGLNGMIEQLLTKNRRGDGGVKLGVMIAHTSAASSDIFAPLLTLALTCVLIALRAPLIPRSSGRGLGLNLSGGCCELSCVILDPMSQSSNQV